LAAVDGLKDRTQMRSNARKQDGVDEDDRIFALLSQFAGFS